MSLSELFWRRSLNIIGMFGLLEGWDWRPRKEPTDGGRGSGAREWMRAYARRLCSAAAPHQHRHHGYGQQPRCRFRHGVDRAEESMLLVVRSGGEVQRT